MIHIILNHTGTQKIETQRLLLRRFDIEDAQSVFNNWMSDPEVQNNYGEAACGSEVEVRQKLQLWISMYGNIDFYRWAIILKESNEHIGQIAFYIVDSKNQRADVEYCIGQPFRGSGYATEALKAVIDYAFSHTGFNRVQGFHRSKNPSSGKVLQKAGMRYEGTLRQYLIHMDEFDDCIMYAIIRQEWESKLDKKIAGEFLNKVKSWAEQDENIRALILVGSYARGEARADSDVDLVVITDTPETYINNPVFADLFFEKVDFKLEDWGKVTSVRVFYKNGLEVEFGITTPDWCSMPLDQGTRRVLSDGYKMIVDKESLFRGVEI